MLRDDGNGSPHASHIGGVIGTTPAQQAEQTGPWVGASSGAVHAAHAGASRKARTASAIVRLTLLVRSVAEATTFIATHLCRPGVVVQPSACAASAFLAKTYSGSSLTSIRSASPQSRSSE
jgi:hypothetical protein